MRKRNASILIAATLTLVGCSGTTFEEPEPYVTEQRERIKERYGTVHGDDRGFVLFSSRGRRGENGAAGGSGPAVNAYLWRAALETVDFMPLAQTDPVGGVVITDWYAPPETPDERFKLTVYVLDTALRADAVRVRVFRQTDDGGTWRDAPVDPETAARLEDNILTRARELRVAAVSASR